MKIQFLKTNNGMTMRVTAEKDDLPEQLATLREIRHLEAQKTGAIESLKDEVIFWRPMKWDLETKIPVRTL